MKNQKVKFRNKDAEIVSKCKNGNYNIKLIDLPVIYEEIKASEITKI